MLQPALFRKTKEVAPYTKLAFIYDFIMRHVKYDEWASYLVRLFNKADSDVSTVLDLSCGTGSLMLQLAELGYAVSGQDYSPDMVRIAKRKFEQRDLHTPLWAGSMTDRVSQKMYDAVVTTYDSLNYCSPISQCEKVFAHVASIVKSGGVFVFDISTIYNSKRYFRRYNDRDRTNKFDYVRQSYYLPDKRKQINEFYITLKTRENVCYKEYHEQKIYRIDELMEIIPQQFFELVGIYDGFSLRPGTEKCDRVHFLLKKKTNGQNS